MCARCLPLHSPFVPMRGRRPRAIRPNATRTARTAAAIQGRRSAMSEDRIDEYGYNIRNELISAAKNAEGAKDVEYRYQYDDIGNRISSHDLGTNRTYIANNLNQYTSISNSAFSVSPREEFIPQFDDDGNQTLIQTASGIWQVHYNGENRPILWECVSFNSPTPNSPTPPLISMSYDRMGRRVTKNDQRFVYDGYLQIANFEEAVTNSQLTTYNSQLFIWDPTKKVATRPLVWRNGDVVAFYTHDGNKNVSEVISDEAEVDAHYEYAPFGVIAVKHGVFAADNPWRFSSEYAEDDTSTVYYNYRYYEPVKGRWLSRDPIDELGSVSLYLFSNNNLDGDQLGLIPRLGELLIMSGALRRMGNNPVVKATGFGSVLIQSALCLYSFATVNQDIPKCVRSYNAQNEFVGQCVGQAREAVSGCVGNLGGAIGGIVGAGKGFIISTILSNIGKQIGNFVGDFVKDFISEDVLKETFCDTLPKVDPCCNFEGL